MTLHRQNLVVGSVVATKYLVKLSYGYCELGAECGSLAKQSH